MSDMASDTGQNIQSVQHPLVKDTAALTQKKARMESGLVLVETKHPIQEALKAGLTPQHYFYLENAQESARVQWPDNMPSYAVSEAVMKKMSTTDSIPPCIATFKAPVTNWQALGKTKFQNDTPARMIEKPLLYILADRMQDPGNLGTLIRTALSFGTTGIILTGRSVDAMSPKVIRASAGMVFACPIVQSEQPIENLLTHPALASCQWLFTTGHATWHDKPITPYRKIDFTRNTLLVLGTEGQGLPEATLAHMENIAQAVTIPLEPQAESLNVSISAAILLAEAHHQRSTLPVKSQ